MSGKDRNIYLESVPLPEALGRWLELCEAEGVRMPLGVEQVPTIESLGRVTTEPLFALSSSPPFHSSAMDGIAVRAELTYGATEVAPVELLLGESAELVDTGEPLPPGFDAVIMVEDLNEVSDRVFQVVKPAAPWQHVRPLGEDIVESELVLPAAHLIRPVDIGALLNAGFSVIPVREAPVVAIVPTGTELVEDPGDLAPGKVMESNSRVLEAYVSRLGGKPARMDLVPDDRETISRSIENALARADIVVVNAGTSAGREDFTRSIVESLGTVAVHGVAIRPGKPVLLGAARGVPVIGLPGFPVANYRAAQEFLGPLVAGMLGVPVLRPPVRDALVARKIFSAPGFDEYVQVKLGRVGGKTVAVPLPRGSGVSMSLVRSDGVVRVPAGVEGMERWAEVEVELTECDLDIEGTILAIGSHDVALDLLAARVRVLDPRQSIASANVGSLGGIAAVRDGLAHVAGCHLLDPATGDFNVPYILKEMNPDDAVLVHMAWRTQGFLVARGNPLGITSIEDLAREDVLFINRQRGSGTRLLTDHLLSKAGIDNESVTGYEREMFTHTAVAAAVAGGTADVGVAVLAAARALKLEFIPVSRERYDLLVPRSFEGSPGFAAIKTALAEPAFRSEVEALGGYDMSDAGAEIPLD